MHPAHPIERTVGMEHYASDADGVGGRLRVDPEDFRVRELERVDFEPLDAGTGAYPHLVLRATLRSWDTNDFADALASRLGISRERVSWAGTKDKHAVTTQLFSVKGADLDSGDLPVLDGADIEAVGRTGRPVLFGDLAGNAFEVRIRDPDAPENAPAVTAALHDFAGSHGERGGDGEGDGTTVAVPNYFGHQRFGTKRPVTHEVGLCVVRGDWERAVMTYLADSTEREPEATREAREFVRETWDWTAALDRFPGGLRYERSLLHSLAETGADAPEDFRAALETLPSNLQALFVNAAQSYAFNRMLSRRLDRGLPFDRPVEGDVVCFRDGDSSRATPARSSRGASRPALPDTDRTQRVTAERVGTVRRHCERGRAFVTAPLVGTDTELGEGEPGDIERAVLDDLDLAPGQFDLPGAFDSTGTRRAVLVWTDVSVEETSVEGDEADALSVAFALPKGSYATVLLREYCKTDPGALS
jgi:tRNA pseudouridine13 synthase